MSLFSFGLFAAFGLAAFARLLFQRWHHRNVLLARRSISSLIAVDRCHQRNLFWNVLIVHTLPIGYGVPSGLPCLLLGIVFSQAHKINIFND